MSQTLRERQRQMVRDEILDAAQALVAQKGYVAVSMDELAAHVGISKPTLYSHFATKEDLVTESVLRDMRRVLAKFEEAGHGIQSPLQQLDMLLRAIINIQIKTQTISIHPWTPELMHMIRNNHHACDYILQMRAATVRLVETGMACGEIDTNLDKSTIIQVFYSLAMSLKFAHFHGGEISDPQKATETILTMFHRAVQPPRS